LVLAGATSGNVTLKTAAVAGTYTFTLPPTVGTNGYYLTTDGSGNASWISLTSEDTVTNAQMYIVLAPAAGGGTLKTSSTNLQFNPGTGRADIKGDIYTQGKVGMADSSNVSKVYQYYNASTDSLDTVFG
jgi:hypothetical protein